MKVRAVGIRGVAARPVDEPAAGAIDRLEPAPRRGHVHDRAEVPGGNAPLAGHPALLEGRDALRSARPAGSAFGKADRHAAEHAPHALHEPAARAIEVEDVRVFVGEDQLEPVGRVADQGLRRRRHRRDLDRVVGRRRRPAVRQDRSGRRGSPARVRAARPGPARTSFAHALGHGGEPPRHRLLPLVRVDVEVRGADGPEPEPRIVAVGRPRGGRGAPAETAATRTLPRRSSGRHP